MKIIKYLKISILNLVWIALVLSCSEDYLDTTYTDGVDEATATELAATDPEALNGYLLGAYQHLVEYDLSGKESHDDFSFMSVLHSTDMSGETMVQSKSSWFTYDYQFNNRMANYRRTKVNWLTFYTEINKANTIIDFFATDPTSADAWSILGQGYALRGMSYYYLIQLYQHSYYADEANLSAPGVPIIAAARDSLTDEDMETIKGRNTVQDVLDVIEHDLVYAVKCLDKGSSRSAKYFVDASVARGFLARYYLLTRQWELAATTANAARADYPIMEPEELHDGFLDIENDEWMWGFDQSTETQTTYASFFSHVSNIAAGYAGIGYGPVLIDAGLYSSISDTDERKYLFTGPNGPDETTYKYIDTNTVSGTTWSLPYANIKFGDDGTWTMDYVYMRAAEMVLIEAEAQAQLGNNTEAATVLADLMEKRDPSWNETSVTVDDIYLQRQIELWGEGFEFFDLKRLNKGIDRNYVGSNHRSGCLLTIEAGTQDWVYQIPTDEIQYNDQISDDENNE